MATNLGEGHEIPGRGEAIDAVAKVINSGVPFMIVFRDGSVMSIINVECSILDLHLALTSVEAAIEWVRETS